MRRGHFSELAARNSQLSPNGVNMVPVIHNTGKLLYEQIYEFYRDAIIRQRLKFNERLPSHRILAKELGIGNNTVIRAYEQLVHEGYVKNESRKGLFVAKLDAHDWQLQSFGKKTPPPSVTRPVKPRPDFKLVDHLVDEKNFPLRHWRKCMNWALDHMSFQYEEHVGKDPLKEQLQQYLFYSRGVTTTPERLIIGSGTNALLFWLAFILRKTHSEIVFEEPCYHRPRHLFSEFGYRITPVPVNDDGIDLPKLLKQRADLLYLTPSHQFPTGGAVPVGNRIQILNWARRNKAYIIEDDFDCEFRYKTRLMPSLQGLDKYHRVIYVGSFSNSIMPSLRVAYLVLPEDFPPIDFRDSAYLTNTVPYIIRRTLAYFMERGYWERHLKKMRKIYQEKYHVSIAALKKLPENCIHFNNTPSGLNIFLRINSKLSEQELIRRALDRGVSITPASGFYHKRSNLPRQPELLFEFGNLPLSEVGNVVEKLYQAWFRQ